MYKSVPLHTIVLNYCVFALCLDHVMCSIRIFFELGLTANPTVGSIRAKSIFVVVFAD
jgi:hypothetical protein